MPYDDYKFSAQTLDNKRLGKQRVETWQILQALRGQTKGWVNHPATRMWENCEQALIHYGMVISAEWQERGFQDIMYDRFRAEFISLDYKIPWWLGFDALHTSHQSNLYRKDPNYYKDFALAPQNLPYVWCRADGTYFEGEKPNVTIL